MTAECLLVSLHSRAPWDDPELLKASKQNQFKQQFFNNDSDSDDQQDNKQQNGNDNSSNNYNNYSSVPQVMEDGIPIPQDIQALKYKNQLEESKQKAQNQIQQSHQEEYVDPLDAFMNQSIIPEIQKKEEEEKQQKIQQQMEGPKGIKQLQKVLDEISDDEETADLEIQVLASKIKLVVGPNGTKINEIQKRSKCRIQIKKDDDDLKKGFGFNENIKDLLKQKEENQQGKLKTIQIFGSSSQVDQARALIMQAVENREQKQKNREKEHDKKREEKQRNRHIFMLRHAKDYEILELKPGASRYDVRKAYRLLALKWHPDKHPDNKEQAVEKFQQIQKAFDSLTRVEEDARVEASRKEVQQEDKQHEGTGFVDDIGVINPKDYGPEVDYNIIHSQLLRLGLQISSIEFDDSTDEQVSYHMENLEGPSALFNINSEKFYLTTQASQIVENAMQNYQQLQYEENNNETQVVPTSQEEYGYGNNLDPEQMFDKYTPEIVDSNDDEEDDGLPDLSHMSKDELFQYMLSPENMQEALKNYEGVEDFSNFPEQEYMGQKLPKVQFKDGKLQLEEEDARFYKQIMGETELNKWLNFENLGEISQNKQPNPGPKMGYGKEAKQRAGPSRKFQKYGLDTQQPKDQVYSGISISNNTKEGKLQSQDYRDEFLKAVAEKQQHERDLLNQPQWEDYEDEDGNEIIEDDDDDDDEEYGSEDDEYEDDDDDDIIDAQYTDGQEEDEDEDDLELKEDGVLKQYQRNDQELDEDGEIVGNLRQGEEEYLSRFTEQGQGLLGYEEGEEEEDEDEGEYDYVVVDDEEEGEGDEEEVGYIRPEDAAHFESEEPLVFEDESEDAKDEDEPILYNNEGVVDTYSYRRPRQIKPYQQSINQLLQDGVDLAQQAQGQGQGQEVQKEVTQLGNQGEVVKQEVLTVKESEDGTINDLLGNDIDVNVKEETIQTGEPDTQKQLNITESEGTIQDILNELSSDQVEQIKNTRDKYWGSELFENTQIDETNEQQERQNLKQQNQLRELEAQKLEEQQQIKEQERLQAQYYDDMAEYIMSNDDPQYNEQDDHQFNEQDDQNINQPQFDQNIMQPNEHERVDAQEQIQEIKQQIYSNNKQKVNPIQELSDSQILDENQQSYYPNQSYSEMLDNKINGNVTEVSGSKIWEGPQNKQTRKVNPAWEISDQQILSLDQVTNNSSQEQQQIDSYPIQLDDDKISLCDNQLNQQEVQFVNPIMEVSEVQDENQEQNKQDLIAQYNQQQQKIDRMHRQMAAFKKQQEQIQLEKQTLQSEIDESQEDEQTPNLKSEATVQQPKRKVVVKKVKLNPNLSKPTNNGLKTLNQKQVIKKETQQSHAPLQEEFETPKNQAQLQQMFKQMSENEQQTGFWTKKYAMKPPQTQDRNSGSRKVNFTQQKSSPLDSSFQRYTIEDVKNLLKKQNQSINLNQVKSRLINDQLDNMKGPAQETVDDSDDEFDDYNKELKSKSKNSMSKSQVSKYQGQTNQKRFDEDYSYDDSYDEDDDDDDDDDDEDNYYGEYDNDPNLENKTDSNSMQKQDSSLLASVNDQKQDEQIGTNGFQQSQTNYQLQLNNNQAQDILLDQEEGEDIEEDLGFEGWSVEELENKFSFGYQSPAPPPKPTGQLKKKLAKQDEESTQTKKNEKGQKRKVKKNVYEFDDDMNLLEGTENEQYDDRGIDSKQLAMIKRLQLEKKEEEQQQEEQKLLRQQKQKEKVSLNLRIVSGRMKNKKLFSREGPLTRPMMEKVRNALFSIIESYFEVTPLREEARWLDLYAGTGSVGLEAVSRGVGTCHFIESDSRVVKEVLNQNVRRCQVQEQCQVYVTTSETFLQKAGELGGSFMGGFYDIISICPPYKLVSYPEIFTLLSKSNLLHDSSLILVEYPKELKHEIPNYVNTLRKTKDRRYGRTFVAIYGPDLE